MATKLCLRHLFGGQLFELFARETNLKKQSSVLRFICLSSMDQDKMSYVMLQRND